LKSGAGEVGEAFGDYNVLGAWVPSELDSILVNLVRRSLLLGSAFLYDEDSRMALPYQDEGLKKRFAWVEALGKDE
jgi:hypothetical protein